jgi:carboxyl-terminal processing protease
MLNHLKNIFKNKVIQFVLIVLIVGLCSFEAADSYFELNKNLDIFQSLYKELNTNYVDPLDPDKMVTTGIDAMLESLDPYTNLITEEDLDNYKFQTTGKYGGIGSQVRDEGEYIVIAEPYEGFPAQRNGLQAGDAIISIDGVSCKNKSISDVSKFLKGIAGTSFKITVKRPGTNEEITKEIKREEISIKSVSYVGMINDKTGYIKFLQFTDECSRQMADGIKELKKNNPNLKSMVIDVRGNPGGLLNEAVNIANFFIPKDKEIVSTKGRMDEWAKKYSALNSPLDVDIPLAILTNHGSASASEILSGVIQDYDRGVIIGQRTFGKGLVQTTRPLAYNYKIKITTAKYYIPSGRCIQALDYSHRNADGSVGKVADSLKHEFKTKNGRKVYDGGGIEPDIKTEEVDLSKLAEELLVKNIIFDFATDYKIKHQTIVSAKQFRLSDSEFDEFVKFASTKNFEHHSESEDAIEEFKNQAEKEKYLDDVKSQIDALKAKLKRDKSQDIYHNKKEIKELLENEIVSRYYFQKGRMEADFNNDPDILKALEVLKNKNQSNQLLGFK